jgi:hypothetical protein
MQRRVAGSPDPSVRIPARQRLDRGDIGASEHRLGHPAAEARPRKGAEFARMVRGCSPKRAKPAPPSEGAGRCEIRVGRLGSQARHGVGDIGGRHSF